MKKKKSIRWVFIFDNRSKHAFRLYRWTITCVVDGFHCFIFLLSILFLFLFVLLEILMFVFYVFFQVLSHQSALCFYYRLYGCLIDETQKKLEPNNNIETLHERGGWQSEDLGLSGWKFLPFEITNLDGLFIIFFHLKKKN